uniref:Uncharacterized protein n=1 Tax=viral metagenome TaxID=1070528 RepID=A0A6M3X670_9ZZZZ
MVETFDWKHETQQEPSYLVRFLGWFLGFLVLSTAIYLILGGAACFSIPLIEYGGGIAVIVLICAVGAAIACDGPSFCRKEKP